MQHATGRAPNRTIGIREAARALGKSPSTIGRYVKMYPELNHGSEGRPKVDLAELRRHREANVNPFRSGSSAGLLVGQVNGADNGHDDIAIAAAYDRARRFARGLQQDFIDLADLLGRQLEAMTDPCEIVELLRTDYQRILRDLISHYPDDAAAEGEPRAPDEVTGS